MPRSVQLQIAPTQSGIDKKRIVQTSPHRLVITVADPIFDCIGRSVPTYRGGKGRETQKTQFKIPCVSSTAFLHRLAVAEVGIDCEFIIIRQFFLKK